ncbi:hypothetical protein R5W24_004000 [Gemmata sp. JC717]|uniref:Uncharacterized protein n=1 Tax=Gemmata algarum TaxID=2975278 RepID=A0ABU5EXI6_9BACT|nr:hypothetical protein [Gemmata algarum]MDY3554870.1 hypothetical protein [Gemmata algarum]MDY3559990.1 hypothetical protein [Gemmata algarum]
MDRTDSVMASFIQEVVRRAAESARTAPGPQDSGAPAHAEAAALVAQASK